MGDAKGFTTHERKAMAQLIGAARWLEHVPATWELVRYARTKRSGLVDVEGHTTKGLDLFGMLAAMILWRDHAHLPLGVAELRFVSGRKAGVAARVKVGR